MHEILKFRSGLVALPVLLLPLCGLCDALTLGGPFTDGAVLQRDRPVRVWGRANPGESVEVAFGGKIASCTADAKGAWRCELPAFAASRESRELVARAKSGEVRVKDVVVGEVWLAGGQSNMEFPLWSSFIRLRDRQGALTAQMCEKPYVRCAVSRKQFQVQEDRDGKLVWKRFEPKMLLNYGVAAVGAYYALELYHALEVPVGLIEASKGGTMIEPWIPREGFAAIPELADLAAVRPKSKIITTDPAYREGRDTQQPTVLWNSCLSFVAPFQVRGTIWYQGESNLRNPRRYFDLMRGLYAGWSRRFENPDFKLYLVQIAPHSYEDCSRMCLLQEQQQRFADTEKNVEIAIINDVGDLTEIHPHEKGTVGKRLAAFALANDYGFKSVKPRAPTPADVKFENGTVTIAFRDAEGLYAYDEPLGFELAGADGQWHDAQVVGFKGRRGGVFKDGKITLSAPAVLSPRHVRYLWKRPYQGHVFSGSAVPLGVFHHDAPGTERDLKVEVSDRYYVDGESGDDKAVGTSGISALRTIDGALARVRALRADGRLPKDRRVTIDLGSGVHVVTKPIVLGPEDSNLLIRGPRPGNTVVRGGVELPPFAEERPGLWSCPVPEGLAVEQLYVNERRCDLARTPNKGWFLMEDYPQEFVDPETGAVTTNKAAVRAFRPSAKDAAALAGLSPEELRAVEVHVWQSWSDGVARLQAYDPKTRTCVTTPSVRWPYSFWKWQGPKRYAFRNLRGALDAPGEWFHDKKAGRLYYVPRADERLDGVTAIVPVAESLLEIRGDRAKGQPVRNVAIEGILFEYAAYRLPAEGRDDAQAAVNEPAAVCVDDAEDLLIGDCAFKHFGAHALWLRRGVRKAKVWVCRFEDLGGGGVYVSTGTKHKPTDPEALFTREVIVDDCIVRGGGREMTGAVGVFLGSAASDCQVTHNWISDFNYSGISCGWSWGYDPTQTKRNKLNWNHIHDLGHGVMSDMAGIYTLGLSEGTEIVGNVIHDVVSYDKSGRGGWGIYTDEGSTGIRVASNLVYRLKTGPVHQNYGRDNVFENNIFAYGGDEQIKRSSPKGEAGRTNDCSLVFRRNIVLMGRNAAFAFARTKNISDTGYLKDLRFDRNVWWRDGGKIGTNAFECLSWDDWRAQGLDADSVVADPRFANAGKADFRLQSTSPAFLCGFVPWDYARAGLYKPSQYWLSRWWKQYETDVSEVCPAKGEPR